MTVTVSTPAEVLVLIASAVREARRRRSWSQARLAKAAGVSLAQIGLLEKGSNVSVAFLSKVASALDLVVSVTDATIQVDAGSGRLDAFELIRKTELLAILVDDLRGIASNAVLPHGDRAKLKDTRLVERFIERALAADESGYERLGEAIRSLSREGQPSLRGDSSPSIHERTAVKASVAHQRRTRKTERE